MNTPNRLKRFINSFRIRLLDAKLYLTDRLAFTGDVHPRNSSVEFCYAEESMTMSMNIAGRQFTVSSEDDISNFNWFISSIPVVERRLILSLFAHSLVSCRANDEHFIRIHHEFIQELIYIINEHLPQTTEQ